MAVPAGRARCTNCNSQQLYVLGAADSQANLISPARISSEASDVPAYTPRLVPAMIGRNACDVTRPGSNLASCAAAAQERVGVTCGPFDGPHTQSQSYGIEASAWAMVGTLERGASAASAWFLRAMHPSPVAFYGRILRCLIAPPRSPLRLQR
jgi:hypothetical protein